MYILRIEQHRSQLRRLEAGLRQRSCRPGEVGLCAATRFLRPVDDANFVSD